MGIQSGLNAPKAKAEAIGLYGDTKTYVEGADAEYPQASEEAPAEEEQQYEEEAPAEEQYEEEAPAEEQYEEEAAAEEQYEDEE